jgi:hypothetical protein
MEFFPRGPLGGPRDPAKSSPQAAARFPAACKWLKTYPNISEIQM